MILVVLSVVLASSMMQAAGGIDWMVTIAAKLIESRPKQITLIAPLVSFLFSVGAGTSNILYPLLPVIYDVSYKNGVRPSRPLSLSVVSTGVALACSPVSAAMAAMVTLTDVPPYDFELIDIIKITFPAAVVGIVLSSIAVNRLGKDLDDDPEIQAKMKSGELALAPAPLSVRIQKLPSAMCLMPEWPCSGWPRNGSETPVGRPADRPSMLPGLSLRWAVVNLPLSCRSAGASLGAGMKLCAGSTAWPARVAG